MIHRGTRSVKERTGSVQGILVLVGLAAALGGACSRELPEEGSKAVIVYRDRCGACHRAYAPGSLKFPTWELIVSRMEAHMRRSARGALSAEERRTILDYLRRHSS